MSVQSGVGGAGYVEEAVQRLLSVQGLTNAAAWLTVGYVDQQFGVMAKDSLLADSIERVEQIMRENPTRTAS